MSISLRFRQALAAFSVATLVFVGAAQAQAPKPKADAPNQGWLDRLFRLTEGESENPNQKNHLKVRAAFKDAVSKVNDSVVRILSGEKLLAMGTVVDGDGYILTKASELRGKLACEFRGGRRLDAEVVGVADDYDLALLHVDTKGLTPVAWRDDVPMVGSWLATPGARDEPMAIGVLSVLARKIAHQPGFLGIAFDEKEEGPKVNEVIPSSGAANAGLKVGDMIVMVEDKEIKSRVMLVETIRQYKPGETIRLKIKRGDKEIEVEARVGVRPDGPLGDKKDIQNSMGGPLSERRVGFPSVLQHDTVLKPEFCGGPIVDLDGKAVGINIARGGRVMSFAVPASVIVPMIVELRAGKYPVPKALAAAQSAPLPSEPSRKVAQLTEAVKKAEAAKAAAELDFTLADSKLKQAKEAREAAEKAFKEAEDAAKKVQARQSEANLAYEALKTELEKAKADKAAAEKSSK